MYLYLIVLNFYFRSFLFLINSNNIWHWRVPVQGLLNEIVVASLFYLGIKACWFVISNRFLQKSLLLAFILLWSVLNYINYEYASVFNSLLPFSWFQEVQNVGAMDSGADLFKGLLSKDTLLLIILPFSVSLLLITYKPSLFFTRIRFLPAIAVFFLGCVAQSTTLYPDIQPKRDSIVQSQLFKYWYYQRKDRPLAKNSARPLPDFSENFKKIVLEKPKTNTLSIPTVKTENPNVVVIMLESFRAYDVGVYGGTEKASPSFDKYSKQGVLFKQIHSAGNMTKFGQFSTLCGAHKHIGGPVLTHFKDHPNICLTDILEEKGYDNWWFHGQSASYDSQGYFFRKHGVHHIMDRLTFPGDAEVLGWGLADLDLMKLALNSLDKAKSPFFWFIQSQTNHHPFNVPPDFRVFKNHSDLLNNFLNAFRYTDYALGYFLDRFLATPQGQNSLIIVLADHGIGLQRTEPNRPPQQEIMASFSIPLLFLYPEAQKIAPKTIDALGSQNDILPTVLDVLQIEPTFPLFGKSLARPYAYRYAKSSVRGNRIIYNGKIYQASPEKSVMSYKGDTLAADSSDNMWFNLINEIDDIQDWIIQQKDTDYVIQQLKEKGWESSNALEPKYTVTTNPAFYAD